MSERIVVFDIEVLNQDPTSVCAIGIVELVDKHIASTYYSLIKPRNLSYDPYRYKVHNIKPRALYQEKRFDEVWQEIKHYFDNSIVIAHDIQGDMMNIREVLKQYRIPYPRLYMSCTNVLAHLVYPQQKKYNLIELSKMTGYEFKAHHALEDAKATAHLLIKMLDDTHNDTLEELHNQFHLEFGEMKKNYYRNIISPELAPQLLELTNKEDSLLYHQSICFTGKLSMPREILEEKTKSVSALSSNQVSLQTNYLVIGEKGFYKVRYGKENKKVNKALQLMKQGQDLKIVHEKQFLEMLDQKR